MNPEKPKSPLASVLIDKLRKLGPTRTVQLLSEYYDPKSFGGATNVRVAIDSIQIEIATRDSSQPFEIELRCNESNSMVRASYAKSFLQHSNDFDQVEPPSGLIDWLVENWTDIYNLVCRPRPEQKKRFDAFSKYVDEARHAKMMNDFKRTTS